MEDANTWDGEDPDAEDCLLLNQRFGFWVLGEADRIRDDIEVKLNQLN